MRRLRGDTSFFLDAFLFLHTALLRLCAPILECEVIMRWQIIFLDAFMSICAALLRLCAAPIRMWGDHEVATSCLDAFFSCVCSNPESVCPTFQTCAPLSTQDSTHNSTLLHRLLRADYYATLLHRLLRALHSLLMPLYMPLHMTLSVNTCAPLPTHDSYTCAPLSRREVGGWGRDPKKCTGRDWGMGSSTI